ncbi:MAG TPA: DNRLRE domain-containing protein [Tepidisphaeraceae bacterium]|nr:DNRLRE domain-containing protein [Tepidisphaeraceae bacterium]
MSRVFQWLAAALVSSCLAHAPSVRAGSITFQQGVSPTGLYNAGGVTIRSDQATTNQNGGAQADQIIVGRNGTPVLRGLLEFDLSAIEAAADGHPYWINSVSLTLVAFHAGNAATGPARYDLLHFGNNLDFDEAAVTWDNAPKNVMPNGSGGETTGTPLADVTYNPNLGTGVTASKVFLDSAAFRAAVTGALGGADNTLRLMLKANSESGVNFTRFFSDDAANLLFRPALTVEFTVAPLPGVVAVGAVLLGGIGGRRILRRPERRPS